MLKPYRADEMEAIPIGRRIGNVKFDDPSLIEPVADTDRVKRETASCASLGERWELDGLNPSP